MDFTCIDSFSGAGGLCLGLTRAGFRILLSFDNDSRCIESQHLNDRYFSHRAVVADVKNFRNGALLREAKIRRGELFLLSGGPPCQGFSVQRIGADVDPRNDLVFDYAELVKEVYPRYFLMENVPGIQGKRGKAVLEEVLKFMTKAGYTVHSKVLDAADYAVPQRRRRLFVIGERADLGFSTFAFPEPTTPAGRRLSVRDTIFDLPVPPLDGSDYPGIAHHRRDKLLDINIKRLMALKPGQGRDFLPEHLLIKAHRVGSSKIGHRYVYGRMAWDEVAPTITARFDSFTRGRFGHPVQPRSITLREGALLQGFPMDFVFSGSKVEIARQIGNAVPPPLAEALGKSILLAHSRASEVAYDKTEIKHAV